MTIPTGRCALAEPMDRRAADRQVQRLKDRITRDVMAYAAQQGVPLRVLVEALLGSAASAIASGVVLDQARKVLCSQDDEAHLESAFLMLRAAVDQQLADARQTLLQPPAFIATPGRPM